MLLIATALALLVIFAGMKLYAQSKKEALGSIFKYMSWFIVVMGFLILLCVGAHCLRTCIFHRGSYVMMKTEMREGDGNKCMENMNLCHGGMMMGSNGCGNMMNGCCGGMKGGCCSEEMNSCKGSMKDNCCDMDMKMHGCTMKEKDSVVIKKK